MNLMFRAIIFILLFVGNWGANAASKVTPTIEEIYQNLYLTERGLDELTSAYAFMLGQQYSEDRFRNISPDRTDEIMSSFHNTFPNLLDSLTSALSAIYSEEKIKGYRNEMITKHFETNPSMNFSIQEENFVALEREIKMRLSGEVQVLQKHLPTFLSVVYNTNSEEEINAGFQKVFSSKGHEKAQGLDLEITVPLSWWGGDATGAHIVQKWKPMNGALNEIYMFIVEELSQEFANNPLKVFLQGGLENIIPGKLTSRYINDSFEKTVLTYQAIADDVEMAGFPDTPRQLVHHNFMVHKNKLLYFSCKKYFKTLADNHVPKHMDDLKNECDFFTANVSLDNL